MSKRVLADNIKWLIGSTLILFLLGCSSESSRKDRIEVDASEISSQELAKEGIQTARQIFYSLPSPLETAMILKRSGAQYNEELLNPVDNASKYTTNKSMALNLGIYSTDLSYASLFDQTQASIKYMAVSKRMAEGLGILNAIDNTIVQRLEENVNNREAIMDIISESLLNTSSILEEDDRVAISSVILVGGRIEGLYIATSLVDDVKQDDNELVDRIIDQKLSLSTVVNLLEQHKDNSDVNEVLGDIKALAAVYEKIQISFSGVEAVEQEGQTTVLRSKNVVSVNPTVFNELRNKVASIRTKYIM